MTSSAEQRTAALPWIRVERNWQIVHGERKRMRGWQVIVAGLVVRYGWYYSPVFAPELRLSVWWHPERPRRATWPLPDLLHVVFPRARHGTDGL